jgi:shikimate kinase
VAHIILTGFMGTGKTEVGRRLARTMGRAFVDTDRLVETKAGRPVAAIFAQQGEAAFRALERDAVVEACALPDAVIATGGGTLIDPENRRRLAAAGPVVCLTASPSEILRRVGDPASRPLLAGATSEPARLARIRDLLAMRATVYGSAAHTIDTTGLAADQVVERVRAIVETR